MVIAFSRSFGQIISLLWTKPIKEASFIFGTDKESPLLTLARDHCVSPLFLTLPMGWGRHLPWRLKGSLMTLSFVLHINMLSFCFGWYKRKFPKGSCVQKPEKKKTTKTEHWTYSAQTLILAFLRSCYQLACLEKLPGHLALVSLATLSVVCAGYHSKASSPSV